MRVILEGVVGFGVGFWACVLLYIRGRPPTCRSSGYGILSRHEDGVEKLGAQVLAALRAVGGRFVGFGIARRLHAFALASAGISLAA